MKDKATLWIQAGIAVVVLAVWAFVQYHILTHAIPDGSRDIVLRAMGILDAALLAVLYFFFGSSRGSARKDELAAESA